MVFKLGLSAAEPSDGESESALEADIALVSKQEVSGKGGRESCGG